VTRHGEYIQVRESDETKHDREEELRLQYIRDLRTLWRSEVLPPSPLNVPGEIMLNLFRPMDGLWDGAEPGPHVATIVQSLETRIRNPIRRRKWLSEEAPRHEVNINPALSDQTYRDTLRTTNAFIDDYDPQLAPNILRHHLVALMTSGDITLPFDNGFSNFFESCAPDYMRFTQYLTPYLLDRFRELEHFSHGIKVIKGGPASGKTAFQIIIALAYATKPTEPKEVRQ
jgi:hypothetical protein